MMKKIFWKLSLIMLFVYGCKYTAKDYYQKGFEKHLKPAAIADLTKAIELDPRHADAYSRRGLVKYYNKDFSGSLADFGESIKIDSFKGEAYIGRGQAKLKMKDYFGAISDFTKCIEINQIRANDTVKISKKDKIVIIISNKFENEMAFTAMAIAKDKLLDYEGAIHDYTKAIEIFPKDADNYFERAIIRNKANDIAGAISDYTKSLVLDPSLNRGLTYYNRGILKYDYKDYHGAIIDFSEYLNIHRDDKLSYFYRGMSKMMLEEDSGAIVDFDKAIKIDLLYINAYIARGRAKSFLNDNIGAISDFDQALKIDPTDSLAREYRSDEEKVFRDNKQ